MTDNNYDNRISLLSNTTTNNSIDISQKSKKEKSIKLTNQTKLSGKLNQVNTEKSFYMQSYSSELNSHLVNENNNSNNNNNHSHSNSSSPIDSPNTQNSNSSLYNQNHSSINNLNNYNLIAGIQNNQNESSNEFNTNMMQRENSASNLSFMTSMKLPTSLSNSTDNHNITNSNNNGKNFCTKYLLKQLDKNHQTIKIFFV